MNEMLSLNRNYVFVGLIFVLVLMGTVLLLQRPQAPPITITTLTPRATLTPGIVVIDVRGAVAAPDVYTLTEGSRVQDALARAGNLLSNGDTTSLNLARKLNDGEQIFVPRIYDPTPLAEGSTSVAIPAPTAQAVGACLPYKDASAHINETTCVRGSVASTVQNGAAFMIYFDDELDSFYAVSFTHKWDTLRNKCVEISGKITPFRNRAQIVIEKAEQFTLCK